MGFWTVVGILQRRVCSGVLPVLSNLTSAFCIDNPILRCLGAAPAG